MNRYLNLQSNLKWIFVAFILSLFCRLFLISVYRIQTNAMSPALISGDLIVANQLAYGFKMPWMKTGYFVSEPQIHDVVVFKVQNKQAEDYQIQRIIEKLPENKYIVNLDSVISGNSKLIIHRDQILSKPWFVVLSVGTTQDSISEQNSVRWNRFLTIIK